MSEAQARCDADLGMASSWSREFSESSVLVRASTADALAARCKAYEQALAKLALSFSESSLKVLPNASVPHPAPQEPFGRGAARDGGAQCRRSARPEVWTGKEFTRVKVGEGRGRTPSCNGAETPPMNWPWTREWASTRREFVRWCTNCYQAGRLPQRAFRRNSHRVASGFQRFLLRFAFSSRGPTRVPALQKGHVRGGLTPAPQMDPRAVASWDPAEPGALPLVSGAAGQRTR